MQYTNDILDLLVTIGCNIQSVLAYRSKEMELRFFKVKYYLFYFRPRVSPGLSVERCGWINKWLYCYDHFSYVILDQ